MKKKCGVEGCDRQHNNNGFCGMHAARWKRHGDPLFTKRTRVSGPPENRFQSYVDKTGECWIWKGRRYQNGYGAISVDGKDVLAHRWSYEKFIGPIAKGLQVDHICMERACVRPTHLRLATNKQNNEHQSVVRSNSTTGYRGVSFERRFNKYRARATHNGRDFHGGLFDTAEEAAEALRLLRLPLFTHNDLDRKGGRGRA